MQVTLTPELEALVREKIESGLYADEGEVVRDALRMMQQAQGLDPETRIALEAGLADFEAGRFTILHTPQEIDDLFKSV